MRFIAFVSGILFAASAWAGGVQIAGKSRELGVDAGFVARMERSAIRVRCTRADALPRIALRSIRATSALAVLRRRGRGRWPSPRP